MTSKPIFHSEKVHVMASKCSTCIFRPGNLMTLQPGVVKRMTEESVAEGASITCHKTLNGGPHDDQRAVCRGFFDAHGHRVPALELAVAMRIIREVHHDG